MLRILYYVIVLLFSLNCSVSDLMAQSEIVPQTIKGDLLTIKGETYVVKDIFGRLVFLHVDKNTKRERLLMPGEKIEADVIHGKQVVALRPAK